MSDEVKHVAVKLIAEQMWDIVHEIDKFSVYTEVEADEPAKYLYQLIKDAEFKALVEAQAQYYGEIE